MREIAEREAAGDSLWMEDIPDAARRKIAHVWETLLKDNVFGQDRDFYRHFEALMRMDGHAWWTTTPGELVQIKDTDQFLSHVEAVERALRAARLDAKLFSKLVDQTFNEHRIAFRMIKGEVVPLSSDELHVEVVEPVLRLLVGAKFKGAHDAYMKALKEISANDPGDAITDAGRALQQALVALGCEGDVLSTLIKDGRVKGLFRSHDQQLEEAVVLVTKWAASERNKLGDTHDDSGPTIADAWLMVHVVGALIVRLADPSRRGSTA